MIKSFYNEIELRKITKLYKTNPWLGLQLLICYLKKYPYDFIARSIYVRMSIVIMDLEEAKIASQENKELLNNYNISNLPQDTLAIFNREMLYHAIRLKFLENEYESAYEKILENKNLFQSERLEITLLYLQKKLGQTMEEKNNQMRYLKRQILQYDYQDFKKHILKHLQEFSNDKGQTVFRREFPLESVLEKLPQNMEEQNRFTTNLLTDIYQFQFDNCGLMGYKNINAFEVVALHNTQDLITMYPVKEYCKEHAIDLNHLNEEKEFTLTRRPSQIEKFNHRYPKIS